VAARASSRAIAIHPACSGSGSSTGGAGDRSAISADGTADGAARRPLSPPTAQPAELVAHERPQRPPPTTTRGADELVAHVPPERPRATSSASRGAAS